MAGPAYHRDRKDQRCRFCKQDGRRLDHFKLVKYGVRHYAHADCLLWEKGYAVLESLSLFELESFPVMAVLTPEGRVLLELAVEAQKAICGVGVKPHSELEAWQEERGRGRKLWAQYRSKVQVADANYRAAHLARNQKG